MKKKVLMICFYLILFTGISNAQDSMPSVFNEVDDLLTRVESGISLNSFAESLATMKINYKAAKSDPEQTNNPLLDDRMGDVIQRLDDYAKAWRLQEVEGYKATTLTSAMASKYSFRDCGINLRNGTVYNLTCIKTVILNDLKPIVERAKSAHFNGW